MKARITYLWNEETYTVSNRSECKDSTDRSAYDELLRGEDRCVCVGKVIIEKEN